MKAKHFRGLVYFSITIQVLSLAIGTYFGWTEIVDACIASVPIVLMQLAVIVFGGLLLKMNVIKKNTFMIIGTILISIITILGLIELWPYIMAYPTISWIYFGISFVAMGFTHLFDNKYIDYTLRELNEKY